ncbi:MAG: hypothetical protein IJU37_10975 [Desulfovibrio sp.]|nr:hypothetical protein [Desulfovibrio sp.]
MTQINDISAASYVSSMNVTGQRSPQLALAMLMLNLADTNKKAAMDGIKEIEDQQAAKKACADALNQARDMKAGHHYLNNWGEEDHIPASLKQWASANGINLVNQDNVGRPKQSGSCDNSKCDAAWDRVIAQIQTKMDTTGADIQTKMVQLQDMMGQYNSYTSGANSAIAKSNDILSSLARGQ